jgi:hypothetical protein
MYGFGFTLTQSNRIRFTEAPKNIIKPSIPELSYRGETIICRPGVWSYVTSQPSFEWFKDGELIPGETREDLFINEDWSRSSIYCSVTYYNVYGRSRVSSNICHIS